jgi:hypothetical protein
MVGRGYGPDVASPAHVFVLRGQVMLSTLFTRFLPTELNALDPVARLAASGRVEFAERITHLEDVYRDIVRETKAIGYCCDVTSRDLDSIRAEVRAVKAEAARQWDALSRPLPALKAPEAARPRLASEGGLAPVRAVAPAKAPDRRVGV